jgi:Holliday junction resolvase RusA-like endonuclease
MSKTYVLIWSEYWVWGVNPEPWRAPGFTHRGRAIVPVKDGKTEAYQEALAEEVVSQNPDLTMHEGELIVEFYFWRSTAYNMPADATNCQKATEDALQGVLYVNDKSNRRVSSMICEQSPETFPAIIIRISKWNPRVVPVLPERPVVGKFEGNNWKPPEKELF